MALQSTAKLKHRLRQIARRERNVIALGGIAKVLIALGLFSGVFFLLDWLFLFSAPVRALLLLGGLGAAVWIAKTELWTPLRKRRDEITTALKIEKKFPELRDRLISVVQLADGAGTVSRELLDRLESETAGMTAPLNFSEIINWRFFGKLLALCAAFVVAGVLCGVVFPQYVSTTFRRMFFGDGRYPSLTRITVNDARTRLVRGDDWNLGVTLAGKIPSSVIMKMRNIATGEGAATGDGKPRWVTVPLKPVLGYTYGLTLQKTQQSFDFQVFAGDAWTDIRTVRVLVPVEVLDPRLDIRPPSYSGLKPVTNAALIGAAVLEGSAVTIRIPATKRVVSGKLLLAGGGERPLQPMTNSPGAAGTFTISGPPASKSGALAPTNGTVGFSVVVKDTDGLENQEPLALYALRVTADQAPRVRLVSPKSDRISVPYAQWKIACEADDDFGLCKAWLAWDVFPTVAAAGESGSGASPAGERKPLRSGRTELPVDANSLRWSGVAILDMVAARTAPGETLVAWVEAADARSSLSTNALPDPAVIGKSAPLAFTIVDESEKWTEILRRLGAVEEVVVRVQDRQESLRKEVEGLKK